MDFKDISDCNEREMWEWMKAQYYGKDVLAGSIDFSPRSMAEVVGGEGLTYDEYLDIQFASENVCRGWFEICYRHAMGDYKGQIQRVKDGKVCFSRVYVCGTEMDGRCFDGYEDHVWMDYAPFKEFKVGDCVSFCAEVYRYLRTGNGKTIDFGLRKPYCIKKIDSYELPTEDDLIRQAADRIVCEACLYREQCYYNFCINPDWQKEMLEAVFNDLKAGIVASSE